MPAAEGDSRRRYCPYLAEVKLIPEFASGTFPDANCACTEMLAVTAMGIASAAWNSL